MGFIIQVDMDAKEDYDKYGYRNIPDFYEEAVKNALDALNDIDATFFVIGRDLFNKRVRVIKKVARHHEVANHSMNHIFGFSKLPLHTKISEITECQKAISKILGKKARGFRAPGYDIDTETLVVLDKLGFEYDSSILPCPYYKIFMLADSFMNGSPLHSHGPSVLRGFSQITPFKLSETLLEIPITVMPIIRMPFYPTFAKKLGHNLTRVGAKMCKLSGININMVFHLIDFSNSNIRTSEKILKILSEN